MGLPDLGALGFDEDGCRSFVSDAVAGGRRIVVITSGGTTVPLERSNVRFIDNFSAGTRGATSAEYFLAHGYAVIFVHRQFSLQPFSRAYTHGRTSLLDHLVAEPDGTLRLDASLSHRLAPVVARYAHVREHRTLHLLHFTTVHEYLHLLRTIALLLRPYNSRVMFYLAAAVSDFVVPDDRLPEHKIQSSSSAPADGGATTLELSLYRAPKVLQTLVEDGWAPRAFLVSFKLETDPALLVPKAQASLRTYGHQCVVANILATRATEVLLVTERGEDRLTVDSTSEIEKPLVDRIVGMHAEWIATHTPALATPIGSPKLSNRTPYFANANTNETLPTHR
ncbi:Phosphopantothenate--cysteine ligase cab2 [Savitreella phatthalungensis]